MYNLNMFRPQITFVIFVFLGLVSYRISIAQAINNDLTTKSDMTDTTERANLPLILTPGGPFSEMVTVAITDDLGGTVHYTLDGSEPTENSPVYERPLEFTATTVLRARIIEEGKYPGDVVTQTYFKDEVFSDHSLPVVSIVTDNDNFWNPESGIYSQTFLPDWETPANIELFLNHGNLHSAFNEKVGIGIDKGYSWQLPQKALSVCFSDKYGEDKLSYQLFDDDNRTKYESFVLRTSGSDWCSTMMRDGLLQQSARMGKMNLDLLAFRPCVVYVNGEFLGVHNIRESFNEEYIKRHYNLSNTRFNMIQDGSLALVGSLASWDKFVSMVRNADLSDDEQFAAIAEEMDIENYTDYVISLIYSADTLSARNTVTWKPLKGGKWRWLLSNCDNGFIYCAKHDLDSAIVKNHFPLSEMLANENYKAYFCQRFSDQLFTTFNAEEMSRQIDTHEADIAPVMDLQVKKWAGTASCYGSTLSSVDFWREQVDMLRDFVHGRVQILLDELSLYGVKKTAHLSVSQSPGSSCSVYFNGHYIGSNRSVGPYPKELNIQLVAEPNAGYTFRGWCQTHIKEEIAKASEWRYLDNGSDQNQSWIYPEFDDSSWKVGSTPIGYGYSDVNTCIDNQSITTYFRKHFYMDKSSSLIGARFQLRRKDGAVVYVNGKRIISSNLPATGLNFKSFASQPADMESGSKYLTYEISIEDLNDGDNIIAVELHRSDHLDNSLVFDFQLLTETLNQEIPLLTSKEVLNLHLTEDTGVCALCEENGDSVLPDSIDRDMTLSKDLSPYIVSRDVVVEADARLVIEPGVTLLFSPNTKIIVHGSMIADGTAEDSILFKLNPIYDASLSWGALCFINTGNRVSSISYAELRDSSNGPSCYNCVAAISGFKTVLHLDHLRIVNTRANPVSCRYSDVTISNSLFHSDITGDLINIKYGKGVVTDCELVGNTQEDTDGIDLDGVCDGLIKRVIIHGFYGDNSDAIDLGEQTKRVVVDSVFIYDITDKGISVGQRSDAIISNTTFIQTNIGVGVKDSSRVEVDRSTFYAVQTPIACQEKVFGRAGGNIWVRSCVFSNTYLNNINCDEKSTVVVNGSLSDTSDLGFGDKNTVADPQFSAPSLYDFSSPLLSEFGAVYIPQCPPVQPVITGICYLPDKVKGETEYIMITNVGGTTIDLSGYTFTKGIRFTFPAGIVLQAGETLFLDGDLKPEIDDSQHLLWEGGELSDEGEIIELATPYDIVIDQVHYLPLSPWPHIDSSEHASILLKDIYKDNHIASNWQLQSSSEIIDTINLDDAPQISYSLLGNMILIRNARGLLLMDGKKLMIK